MVGNYIVSGKCSCEGCTGYTNPKTSLTQQLRKANSMLNQADRHEMRGKDVIFHGSVGLDQFLMSMYNAKSVRVV